MAAQKGLIMSVHTEAVPESAGRGHQFVVVINAAQYTVDSERVSYEQVVALAYPNPPPHGVRYTVTYRKAKQAPEGSLAPGQSVEVKKTGTIFNVTATSKS